MIAARKSLPPAQDQAANLPVDRSIPAAGPDPVLALIEAHRVAYAALDRAARAWTDMDPHDPGYEAAEDATEEPGRREREAFGALLAARPVTAAGLWALAAYLPEAARKVSPDPDLDALKALDVLREGAQRLGLAPAAVLPAAESIHPDAAILALAAPFLAAWRDEGAADPVSTGERRIAPTAGETFEAAHTRCSGMADRIADLPAATPEGLGIKALVLAWCRGENGSPADPMPEPCNASVASDKAMLWQIQAGAARILAGSADAGAELAGSDAEALALVDAIEREWSASAHLLDARTPTDAATAAALARREALLDAADRLPATSRTARHAKAMALAWIASTDRPMVDVPRSSYATDAGLAFDIAASLTTAGTVTEAGR